MAGALRDQALSLLAAVNNHGDLAVKLSSFRQFGEILSSVNPSLASELFPYLVELQNSPESLVRRLLIEVMEDVGLKAMEQSSILMPVLLALLKDSDSIVSKQAIVSGTSFFCNMLEEMALQFHRFGKVERWLEELWTWMLKFKDAVLGIALEPGPVGARVLAMKFLETFVLLFSADANDFEKSIAEGSGRAFNISWIGGGHPVLDPLTLTSEANRTIGILLNLFQSASNFPAIARKRPLHYNTILSALLDFEPSIEMKGGHSASIQYSFRTALLGFLRCTQPTISESRDRLLRSLRAMNAGEAADQVIRQVDKIMKNNERAPRDVRLNKDDQPSNHLPMSGEIIKKRAMIMENEEMTTIHEWASKRTRYGFSSYSAEPVQMSDSVHDLVSGDGVSPQFPVPEGELTPAEQMIAMIGALLAEGERGAESLEILISKMHPDLLADIVITNMKYLPKIPPPSTRLGNSPVNLQVVSSVNHAQVSAATSAISVQSPVAPAQAPFTMAATANISLSDTSSVSILPGDPKRDPRRDPRRLDPRRVMLSAAVPSAPVVEDNTGMQPDTEISAGLSKPLPLASVAGVEYSSPPLMSNAKSDTFSESPPTTGTNEQTTEEEMIPDGPNHSTSGPEVNSSSDDVIHPDHMINQQEIAEKAAELAATERIDTSFLDTDELSPTVSSTSASEESILDLPTLPLFVEMTEEQQRKVKSLAIQRIIKSSKYLGGTDANETHMALLARLVAQIDASDELLGSLQEHIVEEYQQQKGHELVMYILYHLHTLSASDSTELSKFAAKEYESFLLTVAKSLLDALPASDKSFSRLLGEAPSLPDSALKLLEDLCCSDGFDKRGNAVRDGDRVMQGLGAVWSLIVGRPVSRQTCLSIVLKCAVHSQDDIRTKAIRLVTNKLYLLSYISQNIEEFATGMLLSAVDQRLSDTELLQSGLNEQRLAAEVGSHEPSISGSQVSETATSENDSMKAVQTVSQNAPMVSSLDAQHLISLFFALCTKKPGLLQLVFDVYGRASKSVKQAIHRHVPALIRALTPSYTELLRIISDSPHGSENLLMLVLQILTTESTPSSELIATVKHLYETKLKDAAVLIPLLSSLSKAEVLPIFPRLVDLPLDKFQTALAHILQGSAHTGPALTPAEVLVAIHDISPEKDDACSACFEQRTVFTQQVLAKALNQMVDQVPLPMLFMRTVIQAIDAFPTLVDFVMEILSKLVRKQVWRMPKLWVGFLKCVSQTQPHSFHVLLQLPPPQLESALNKYSNLRGPLAAYAGQPAVRNSLPRSTLVVLGLANESHVQQSHHSSSLHASETGSSVHGATLT
ncbi:Symplekin C-terminal [Dillenia turbinata]|uniref:Symplekin C-terminal n=1 Tax=Dillenia turbinata TaxID=194707 RepID=A0AAN8W2H0_9MAGN